MTKPKRVGELEDELERRDERITELREEIDDLRDLVRRMEEHVDDANGTLERWRETFDMVETERGTWTTAPWWEAHDKLVADFNDLARRWNKFLPLLNQNPVGRPLAASEAQQALVRKRRKAGKSLRWIEAETNLSLQTVRTIVGKTDGTDRTTKQRRIALDHPTVVAWKRKRRTGQGLPRQAQAVVETGRDLLKEAKGRK